MSTLPSSAFETGQLTLAPSAASLKAASSTPGTSPRTRTVIFVSRKPASVLSNEAVASVSSRAGA